MSEDRSITATTPNLGARIDELWNDEGCSWQVRLDYRWWTVVLDWWTEGGLHDANYSTLTWEFYAESLDVALAETVEWLENLTPWRPCPECDGQGAWRNETCEACNATGLANGRTEGDDAR